MTRWLVRVAGVLLVSVAMLAALEGLLRLVGFQAQVGARGDPLLNPLVFQRKRGVLGVPMIQMRSGVAFRENKPANGFRVFVVGESSVLGYPFGPQYAFSRFLRERLAAAMRARTVEVVNFGFNGIGSWHARAVVDEVVRYHPDVIIVYTGHNDWITPGPEVVNPLVRRASQLRFFQLATVAGDAWQRWRKGRDFDVERLRSALDTFARARDRARGLQTLAPREREWITARFADNLRAIVATGRAAGASVILAGLAQNLSDFPPGASRHRRGLSEAERTAWRQAVNEADARMRMRDCQTALGKLQQAERIDRRPAILHYLRGRCLEDLGDFAGARAAYELASDLDEVPLGAPSVFNDIMQQVANETGAQFVDVPAALARSSPHGLLGKTLFYDHLHPTVAGHAAIARVLAEAMGAPDDGDHATDPAALTAAHPEIQARIYEATTILYLMLGWRDRVRAELDEAVQRYPTMLSFRNKIEALQANNPVSRWDDFPDEAGN